MKYTNKESFGLNSKRSDILDSSNDEFHLFI